MTQFTLLFASTLGCLAVIFGSFGAHALKKTLSKDIARNGAPAKSSLLTSFTTSMIIPF